MRGNSSRAPAHPRAGAVGLTTYDAKDPDTSFPPIEPLLPPAGAPNVLVVLIDDTAFGASWVQLDVGEDDHDHLITPEQRLQVAMARQ